MLTIGDFARQGGVTPRMLRHYDRLGLLQPARTGENGYRYYDGAQLSTLMQIETLKRYGFSLAEVAELLLLPPQQLARRVHKRRLDAYGELAEMRRSLRRMERDIAQMEGALMNKELKGPYEKYHVIVMDAPEQRVFGIRRTINISQTNELFAELLAEAERLGLKRTGATQQMYMGDEAGFDYDHLDIEAQVEVSGDAEGVHTLPGGTFVATTHTGPYSEVRYAYEALAAWLAAHPEYQVRGPGIERYLKDEDMVDNEEDLETGVLFPVVKIG